MCYLGRGPRGMVVCRAMLARTQGRGHERIDRARVWGRPAACVTLEVCDEAHHAAAPPLCRKHARGAELCSSVLCRAVWSRAVLSCAVPCRAVLCCAVLCCAVLCCAVLCRAVLCH